jgi:hypothetical protein
VKTFNNELCGLATKILYLSDAEGARPCEMPQIAQAMIKIAELARATE